MTFWEERSDYIVGDFPVRSPTSLYLPYLVQTGAVLAGLDLAVAHVGDILGLRRRER